MKYLCPVCGSEHLEQFLYLRDMPNTMRLLASPDAPDTLFNLDMRLCTDCGFVFTANELPVADFYDTTQMPTSQFPPDHLDRLQQDIAARAGISPGALLYEIGCNDGDFMRHFKAKGFDNLHGIEPAGQCIDKARDAGVEVTHGYFGEAAARAFVQEHGTPRAVFSRHVVEHIANLDDLLAGIDLLCAEDTLLTIEVPDFGRTVDLCQFCNLWEQHINHFDAHSLTTLLARIGMSPVAVATEPFSGGSLIVHFRRGAGDPAWVSPGARRADKRAFPDRMRAMTARIRDLMDDLASRGGVAAFGPGGRGSCFVNIADIADRIAFAIDDNPAKIGRFMTKSKLPIKGSDRLAREAVASCIILPMNKKEMEFAIMKRHAAFLEAGGAFVEFWPDNGSLFTVHTRSTDNEGKSNA